MKQQKNELKKLYQEIKQTTTTMICIQMIFLLKKS